MSGRRWASLALVIAVCPAPSALVGPLSAAFRTIKHVESVAEPVDEKYHFDWWFSELFKI